MCRRRTRQWYYLAPVRVEDLVLSVRRERCLDSLALAPLSSLEMALGFAMLPCRGPMVERYLGSRKESRQSSELPAVVHHPLDRTHKRHRKSEQLRRYILLFIPCLLQGRFVRLHWTTRGTQGKNDKACRVANIAHSRAGRICARIGVSGHDIDPWEKR